MSDPSSPTIEELERRINELDTNFIIIASLLGATCGVLLLLTIGAFIWLVSLSKQIQNGPETFKIKRPKLNTSSSPSYNAATTTSTFDKRLSTNNSSRNTFDNPNFTRNPLSNNSNLYFASDNINSNPRSNKNPIDNTNFSFGPQYTSNFRDPVPDYTRDSKFY